jgi:oxygen-independent coproporphyrinogen-3 oxidase
MQNVDTYEAYAAAIQQDCLPLGRALRPSDEEKFIREFVLQLKLGSIRPSYFTGKYGVDVRARYRDELAHLESEGLVTVATDRVAVTRAGLLQVDSLLPRFFKPEHQTVRYT